MHICRCWWRDYPVFHVVSGATSSSSALGFRGLVFVPAYWELPTCIGVLTSFALSLSHTLSDPPLCQPTRNVLALMLRFR
jgi:hypothetical protein